VQPVLNADDVLALQTLVRDVHVSTDLMAWINRLVRASRPQLSDIVAVKDWVRWGAGPRAGQSLVLCAKARALLHGRLAATRDDVQALAMPVLRHRLLLSFAAEADGRTAQDVVAALLAEVPYAT
jgi:MoxR-like ATPase